MTTADLLTPHLRLGFYNIRDAARYVDVKLDTFHHNIGVAISPPCAPDAGRSPVFLHRGRSEGHPSIVFAAAALQAP